MEENPNQNNNSQTAAHSADGSAVLFTPGPWRWEINLKTKNLELCGGVPEYDLTVLDFVRWGMDGAQARFRDKDGLMQKASEMTSKVAGREHHAHWFQTIDHPDARLIAAAPELFKIAKAYLYFMEDILGKCDGTEDVYLIGKNCEQCRIRALIDRIEGGAK